MFWMIVLSSISILWTFHGVLCKESVSDSGRISASPQRIFYDVLSKIPASMRKRDLWELVSSTSDVVPIRSTTSQGYYSMSAYPTVQLRLQKLDYYFNALKIPEEDCRQRLLCEVAQDPSKFSPLSSAFLDETRYNGNKEELSIRLLATNEGARLMTYIEAAEKGHERDGCEIWTYRCPRTSTSMINYRSLLVWRELSKWLTVQMVAKLS